MKACYYELVPWIWEKSKHNFASNLPEATRQIARDWLKISMSAFAASSLLTKRILATKMEKPMSRARPVPKMRISPAICRHKNMKTKIDQTLFITSSFLSITKANMSTTFEVTGQKYRIRNLGTGIRFSPPHLNKFGATAWFVLDYYGISPPALSWLNRRSIISNTVTKKLFWHQLIQYSILILYW